MDKTLDSSLIAKSVLFHGSQLKKIWENERGEGDLRKLGIDISDVAQPQLNKLISYQDRGRRLKLHSFISRHANVLFDEVLNVRTASAPLSNSAQHYALLPPYEMFAGVEKKDRLKNFFAGLKVGDLIFGPLIAKINSGFVIKVLCSEGETNRICADITVKAVIHTGNMIGCVDKKNITRSFAVNDIVCCEVLELSSVSEKIFAGMKGEQCSVTVRNRLGLANPEDLPAFYRMWQEGMKPYDEMLQNSVGFHNPGCTKVLSEQLGLGNENYSNFSALRFGFPTEEKASELRQAQSAKWAYKSVSDGIALFKANKHAEAFLCLNKALSIDPNNVEALVARGALSANGGNFQKAVDDFEAAMKVNNSHQNARKYLAETLIAYGRSFEEEEKWEEAIKCYEKCLQVNPNHKDAKSSIEYINKKIGGRSEPETIPLLPPTKTQGVKDALKQLLSSPDKKKKKKKDKKTKKKKTRSSSSSSSGSSASSSSSSSSSSSTSTASSRDSPHKHQKKKRKGEKDKSLSPISKRMAMMESSLLESGFDAENNKSSHSNNPPPGYPYLYGRNENVYDLTAAALLKQAAAAQEADEYDMRYKRFLDPNKADDDYEESVKKFLEQTSQRKKDKSKDDKKKKKKKDKKGKKKKKEEKKKLKKAVKDDKVRRDSNSKRRRSESHLEDDEYQPKLDISQLVNNFDSLQDLEEQLQTQLSNLYPNKVSTSKKKDSHGSEKQARRSSPRQLFKDDHMRREISEERIVQRVSVGRDHDPPPKRQVKKDLDIFDDRSLSPPKRRSRSSSHDFGRFKSRSPLPSQSSQKIKMMINSKQKKKDKFEDVLGLENWDDNNHMVDLKDVEPPPLPPTKDEMAMNLKKIVDKKKEDGTKQQTSSQNIPVNVGSNVMDRLGGFRINPAALPEKKRSSRSHSALSSSRRSLSRSPSIPPRRRPPGSGSSGRDSRTRSRSTERSYPRIRRYSSESGSDRSRSRSYSRSRSRSRSFRSRSRSNDRFRRYGRGMQRRGTYYKPRFGFKRGYNNRGYNNRRVGFRDYRNRGYNNYNRGRGRGRGGPRYFDYRNNRSHDRYDRRERRYSDRSPLSRSDEDSPMRKVDAARERIDKMLNQPRSPRDSERNYRDHGQYSPPRESDVLPPPGTE